MNDDEFYASLTKEEKEIYAFLSEEKKAQFRKSVEDIKKGVDHGKTFKR